MATKPKDRPQAPAASAGNQKSSNGTAPVPEAKLKQIYSLMLKCRTMEEKIRILFKQGRFSGNYYAAVGQEATEVGCAIDLRPTDTIAPSHRDFISNLIKGTPLQFMLSQIYARRTSPDQGRSSPAHCGNAPLNIITPPSPITAQLRLVL